jgi:Ca2+-binding RTX toxin-like protein
VCSILGVISPDWITENVPLKRANARNNDDIIRLDDAVYTQIGRVMKAEYFRVGTSALDANDYLVYNQTTGALSYDADGSGGGAAIRFLTLLNKPVLTSNDFAVLL